MALDFDTLEQLRLRHPAWRFLWSDHAPLLAAFLHRAFLAPNRRYIGEADVAEALEDELYALRERRGADSFPKSAREYLKDWSDPGKAWLRRFYRQASDEPCYDLTPATERAIAWLSSLAERSFVGTESRLLTLFELLRQMVAGSETDPAARVAELRKRRDTLDAEIARAEAGELPLLDDTGLRDRFQQFTQLARQLLTDFREVEANFRRLDREVRALEPDPRLGRIHYDWLEAGEHTQRTVAELPRQLRRPGGRLQPAVRLSRQARASAFPTSGPCHGHAGRHGFLAR